MVITPEQIQLNDIIKFRTLSPHDTVTWSGEVISICDYDIALLFGQDIIAYYQDINRNTLGGLPAKETLTYFVLKVSVTDVANNTVSEKRVFAYEFIDVSTLERISEQTYTDYRVYDISPDKREDVRNAINSLGYVVDILTQ